MARILVSATGGPLADVEVTFLHNDAAGSPVAATNAAGAVKWSRGYQPYGEFSSQTGTASDTRQFFHGKPLDGESGLQYFGARYYDPLLGRFMAMDPAPWNEANLHSFNRYAFANNNPTRFTDPDGNSPVDLFFLGVDVLKLGYAVYRGDGVKDAAIDVGLSLVGVLSPVPGSGQVLKAGRVVNEAKVAAKAADNAWDSFRAAEQVKKNRDAGNAARDAIAAREGGAIEQAVNVTGGRRVHDVLVGKGAIESKVGRTGLTEDTRRQIARDVKSLRAGERDSVVWEFSKSPTTGKSGPTQALRDKLDKFGIGIRE